MTAPLTSSTRSARPTWLNSEASYITCTVTIVLVIAAGFAIQAIPGWTDAELAFLIHVSNFHGPVGNAVALGMSWLFSPLIGSSILIAVAGVMLIVTRSFLMPAQMLILVVLPWLGSDLMKILVHRPRPDLTQLSDALAAEPTSFSYPSGHTTFAAAFCLALLITLWTTRWRPVFIAIAIVVPLLMAACRVYLGVHYPSDVIAGLLYATAAVGLAGGLFEKYAWPQRRAL